MVRESVVMGRFSRAADSYDRVAVAQREICERLFSLIKPLVSIEGRIFEFGCGTGNLSSLLVGLSPRELVLNDLCESYRDILDKKLSSSDYRFVSGDALSYSLQLKDEGREFDLIASSSAMQWFDDPFLLIDRALDLLGEGGVLALSSFAQGNISEVTSISHRGLEYPSMDSLVEYLSIRGEVLHSSVEDITLQFSSPLDVLSHLKLSGVTASSHSQGGWTRGDLRRFTEQYRRNDDGSSPLTYRPLYIICRKR